MVSVYNTNGEKIEEIELPEVFKTKYRPDVIRKDFRVYMSKLRQPYGTDVFAGKRTSAHYHGKRRYRYTMMNREMSRLPRIHGGGYLQWRARFAPHAVKGRRAHPPKSTKKWELKINKKEEMLAIKSAIAASANLKLVHAHGYKTVKEVPIVVSDDFENIQKTKELYNALNKIGLEKEVERIKEKKVRAGKGKMRGRKYKKKKGILIVVSQDCNLLKAGKNIADVATVDDLNIALLAPGGDAGRLIVFTKSSLKKLAALGDKNEQ